MLLTWTLPQLLVDFLIRIFYIISTLADRLNSINLFWAVQSWQCFLFCGLAIRQNVQTSSSEKEKKTHLIFNPLIWLNNDSKTCLYCWARRALHIFYLLRISLLLLGGERKEECSCAMEKNNCHKHCGTKKEAASCYSNKFDIMVWG